MNLLILKNAAGRVTALDPGRVIAIDDTGAVIQVTYCRGAEKALVQNVLRPDNDSALALCTAINEARHIQDGNLGALLLNAQRHTDELTRVIVNRVVEAMQPVFQKAAPTKAQLERMLNEVVPGMVDAAIQNLAVTDAVAEAAAGL
jgi:hypothetical protein